MMNWTGADVAAFYAAVVATGALLLEIRRWVESRASLSLTASSGFKMVFAGVVDNKHYISVSVTNRGQAATTITHLGLDVYPSVWKWLLNSPTETFAVPMANPAGGQQLPVLLGPGHYWSGLVHQDQDLTEKIERGHVWVAIYATHDEKPIRRRVRNSSKSAPNDTA